MARSRWWSVRTATVGSSLFFSAVLVGLPHDAIDADGPPVPTIEVIDIWGTWVGGDAWTGDTVTIDVFDPTASLVWSDQFPVDGNQFGAGLDGIEGFGSDWSVIVSGENGTKTLQIPLLTVDRVDTTTGVVSGTSDTDLEFVVLSCRAGPEPCNEAPFTNDGTPDWTSDSVPVADRSVGVRYFDADGDSYRSDYIWPGLRYTRSWSPAGAAHWLGASMFPPDADITFTVDGPGTDFDQTVSARTDDGGNSGLDLAGPEMTVPIVTPAVVGTNWTFSAETYVDEWTMRKQLAGVDLTIDPVDHHTPTASGTCTTDYELQIQLLRGQWFSDDQEDREPGCDGGAWQATWDLDNNRVPEVTAWTSEYDNDRFEAKRERPSLGYSEDSVAPARLGFHRWEMAEQTTLTVTDESGGEVWSGPVNDDVVELPGEPGRYDLRLDRVIDASAVVDGWTFLAQSANQLKSVVVETVTIDRNPDGTAAVNEFGEVTGTAPPDSFLIVYADGNETQTWSDGDGNWAAAGDFEGAAEVQAWLSDHDGDSNSVEAPLTTGGECGDPWLVVGVNQDVVRGDCWSEGANVHLTIDDPATTGEGFEPDFESETTAGGGGHGNVFFWVAEEFDVQAGHEVTLSSVEPALTLFHVVQSVEVSEVDVDNDRVHGSADPLDQIWVFTTDQPGGAVRLVTAHETDGSWLADFSTPGTEPFEQTTADLAPGVTGGATEHDPVNDGETEFVWRVPDPRFEVDPIFGSVGGQDWQEGAEVTVTIDDPDTPESPDVELSAPVETFGPWEPPSFETHVGSEEFTIEAGHVVTVTDGDASKMHIVTNLRVTGASADDDTVTGTGAAGSHVVVFVHSEEGGIERVVTVESDGTWTADFSTAPPEEESFDLQPGIAVQAYESDADGDATTGRWELIEPRLTVDQFDDVVRLHWPESDVSFDVRVSALGDGSTRTTAETTGQIGEFPWETGVLLDLYLDDLDVVTGTLVEVIEPVTSYVVRSLEVSALTVTQLDPDDDGTVRGVASPGSTVTLGLSNSTGWAWRSVEVGGDGSWIAHLGDDAGMWGEEGDGIVEDVGFRFEVGFGAEQRDDDGDATVVQWEEYRVGGIAALPDGDIVFSHRWTGLWPATLTIDGYEQTGIPLDRGPSVAELGGEPVFFDAPEWEDHFALQLGFDLAAGQLVTVSDGLYTVSTVVSAIAVTEVDLASDVIRGTATPGDAVLVFVTAPTPGEPYFESVRFACTAMDGTWVTDFGAPLVGPLELECLPDDAAPALGPGDEIPAFDLDHTTVVRGLASTTDSQDPFGENPDKDDGTTVIWWTHLTELEATPALAEAGITEVSFSATIAGTDPDDPRRHAVGAVVDWGDGSSTVLDGADLDPGVDGDIALSAVHTYPAADVEAIMLTVEFEDGHVEVEAYRYVVIHDPTDGFVTGAGWMWSPAGAYVPEPDLEGRAHFGFVSKYQRGADIPTGNTRFVFRAAGLRFEATSYDWLVVAGHDRAKFKGEGAVNGEPGYSFMLTATDGDPDTFRIKITGPGGLVYDNKVGVDEYGWDGTGIGGGSVVVHT